jgi:hypothetical protein
MWVCVLTSKQSGLFINQTTSAVSIVGFVVVVGRVWVGHGLTNFRRSSTNCPVRMAGASSRNPIGFTFLILRTPKSRVDLRDETTLTYTERVGGKVLLGLIIQHISKTQVTSFSSTSTWELKLWASWRSCNKLLV